MTIPAKKPGFHTSPIECNGKVIGYRIALGDGPPRPLPRNDHNCWDYACPYTFYLNTVRYRGWECSHCGKMLQANLKDKTP